jgi:hypothetical protein
MSQGQPNTPGAPRSPARTRVLACPSCGGSVTVRANGISITAICQSCGSTLDIANPDVRLIDEVRKRTHESPIPIGKRATLVGAEWEVVGFQTRSDPVNGWRWDEYLLFNPYLGFRFLAQDDEDWTLYCMLRQDVPDPEQGFEGHRYTLNSSSTARTDYVLGEFYWRVKVGDVASVSEYIDEPYLLSREQNNEEIIWSRGLQLSADTVRTAFGLSAEIVPSTSVDKVELRRARYRGVKWVALLSLLALVIAHSVTFGTSRSLVVFNQYFHTTSADKGRTISTDDFVVPEKGGNLRITARSAVNNNWMEPDIALVGPGDVVFNATPSIEYYTGTDSDGDWSEGAQYAEVTFASVPGGTYRLLIEPYAGAYATNPSRPAWAPSRDSVDFSITVTRHVPSGWNFFFALLLLVPYPIYRFFADWGPRHASSPTSQPKAHK